MQIQGDVLLHHVHRKGREYCMSACMCMHIFGRRVDMFNEDVAYTYHCKKAIDNLTSLSLLFQSAVGAQMNTVFSDYTCACMQCVRNVETITLKLCN